MKKTNLKRGGFMKGRLLTIILGVSLALSSVWAEDPKTTTSSLNLSIPVVSTGSIKLNFDNLLGGGQAVDTSFLNQTCRWSNPVIDGVINLTSTIGNLAIMSRYINYMKLVEKDNYDLDKTYTQGYFGLEQTKALYAFNNMQT
ncbi:MAG: hypothetical protein V1647_00115, partial [Pseudomonadota bacterium]